MYNRYIILVIIMYLIFIIYCNNNIEQSTEIINKTLDLEQNINNNNFCINNNHDSKYHKIIDYKCKYAYIDLEDDIFSCERVNLNKHLVDINRDIITKLRCLEYGNKDTIDVKYAKARPIFKKSYKLFYEDKPFKKHSIVIYQEFIKELYNRYIYYYPYINTLKIFNNKNIEIYFHTRQNHSIIPLIERKIKLPILHFDSHSDYKDYDYYDEYIEAINNNNIDKVKKYNYDIATFTSHYTTYSKKNFIWIYPNWLIKEEKPEVSLNIIERNKNNEGVTKEVEKKVYGAYYYAKGDTTELKKYYKYLDKQYVLSIDLDYFCTNGGLVKKNDTSYEVDPISFYRTRYKTEFNTPFYYYTDADKEYSEYLKDLNNEYKFIHNRIKIFLFEMLQLKNNSYIPKIILICDSSNILISKDYNSISITNDFCPSYMVLFIKHHLMYGLQKIFSDTVIPYLEFP